MCDTLNYDLRNLTNGESVVAKRPFNAVTFVENHDMGGNEIVNDKNARLFVHTDERRLSVHLLVRLLQPGAGAAGDAEWHRRADRCAPSVR